MPDINGGYTIIPGNESFKESDFVIIYDYIIPHFPDELNLQQQAQLRINPVFCVNIGTPRPEFRPKITHQLYRLTSTAILHYLLLFFLFPLPNFGS